MGNQKLEKIILAAKAVFLRYGYKRVTMNDIAQAAKISRPAIYLAFQNKEEVFKAVIKHAASKNLDEIHQGITRFSSISEQLSYAFELWTIRPFEKIKNAPEAEDLLSAGHEFCQSAINEIALSFEAELVKILRPHVEQMDLKFSAAKIAHMMRCAVHGFKETAKTATELRQMIKLLIRLIRPE